MDNNKEITNEAISIGIYKMIESYKSELFIMMSPVKYRELKNNDEFYNKEFDGVPIILDPNIEKEEFMIGHSCKPHIDSIKLKRIPNWIVKLFN